MPPALQVIMTSALYIFLFLDLVSYFAVEYLSQDLALKKLKRIVFQLFLYPKI
jgi:hypothetical protein